jgi:hypothetical protein
MSASKWWKPIKAQKPKDLSDFHGKTMRMMDGETVKIETIVGSMFKPTRFEVNGKHHIVILDAYRQLTGDKSITQEMIDAFDEMHCESVEKIAKPDPLKVVPTPKYEK